MALNNPNPGTWKVSNISPRLITKAENLLFDIFYSYVPGLIMSLMCVSLYTHQCAHAACAYYMYAFVFPADHGL